MQLKPYKWFYLLPTLMLFSTLAFSAETPTAHQSAATLYKDECSSCHMAYPVELLPARSWDKILTHLDQHLGDNASLDADTLAQLRQYLRDNNADTIDSRRSRRLLRSLPADTTSLRITELPYIRRQHGEIPRRYISGNPQVKRLGNCIACHQGAEQGVFSEHQIRIPGYGRWDD